MGGAICCHGGPALVLDPALQPLCDKIGLSTDDAMGLHKKFLVIDSDNNGTITLDEFFEFLEEDKSLFATQLFNMIDENGSKEIDFKEFLVGLWNVCPLEEEAVIRVAFDTIARDTIATSNSCKGKHIEGLVKAIHGKHATAKMMQRVRKVLEKFSPQEPLDKEFTFEEFKGFRDQLPAVFLPAFILIGKIRDNFYGPSFSAMVLESKEQSIPQPTRKKEQQPKAAPKLRVEDDKYRRRKDDRMSGGIAMPEEEAKLAIHRTQSAILDKAERVTRNKTCAQDIESNEQKPAAMQATGKRAVNPKLKPISARTSQLSRTFSDVHGNTNQSKLERRKSMSGSKSLSRSDTNLSRSERRRSISKNTMT